jgi:hypothetical protein
MSRQTNRLLRQQENQADERNQKPEDQGTINGTETDLGRRLVRRKGDFVDSAFLMHGVTKFSHA